METITVTCLLLLSAWQQGQLSPPTDSPQHASFQRNITAAILSDQKRIWTSPFHTSRADAKWWGIFGVATGALIATDFRTATQLPNTASQLAFSRNFSNLGGPYSTYGIAAGFYLVGKLFDAPKARETGRLSLEAITDSVVVAYALKLTTRRQRPLDSDHHGEFFEGGNSFPSGHTIMSWTLATVIASEYSDHILVPVAAYGLATTIAAARFSARKHFASDIVAGAGMGWFIGRYVYKRRHDTSLDTSSKLSLVPNIEPELQPGTHTYALSLNWHR